MIEKALGDVKAKVYKALSLCLYHGKHTYDPEHLVYDLEMMASTQGINDNHPCSCQPPTMWGVTITWHCECCEQPTAARKYLLCDRCESHEYAGTITVEADHEDMRLLDEHQPSLPPLRGRGGGIAMSSGGIVGSERRSGVTQAESAGPGTDE